MQITYSNQIQHKGKSFIDYQKTFHYSHSFLKNEESGIAKKLVVNEMMLIGSMVDAILTEPHKVDMSSEYYPIARDIARELRKAFPYIDHFEKQISITSDTSCADFTMKTKGRLDYLLPGKLITDLKITKTKIKDIPALIDFMGYKNQIWHYCKLASVNDAYLMFYSISDKKTCLFRYDCSSNENPFWQEKIFKFGKIIQNGDKLISNELSKFPALKPSQDF